MTNDLKLVKIDYKYCNYLRQFDNKVPLNYGKKETRPFVGVLFIVNNFEYFAPLSSPKPKHLKMESKLDFFKIDNGKLGAINFNNMIPVTDRNIINLDLDKVYEDNDSNRYQKLLKSQLFWLNRHRKSLYYRANTLYNNYISNKLPKNIKKRCIDFKLLEEKCLEYNNLVTIQ